VVPSWLDENGELSLIVFEDDDEEKPTINELLIELGVAESDVFHVEKKISIPNEPIPAPGTTLTVQVKSVAVRPFRLYVASITVEGPATFNNLNVSKRV